LELYDGGDFLIFQLQFGEDGSGMGLGEPVNEIAVCVVTCRRPDGLARLLAALARLEVPIGATVRFVVVDNDPRAAVAREVVEAWRHRLPGALTYAGEPRPGVSQARNAALRLAAPAPLVAFIDDDETSEPDWLARLLACWRQTGAVAISGPVRPRFDTGVPEWLAATFGLCYVRPKPGRPMDELQSNNLLLDRSYLERAGLAFDERLGGQGGEDTQLGNAIKARGGRLGWCEDAVVHEHIAAERARLLWLLGRWMRTGGTEIVLAGMAMPRARARLQGLLRGGTRVLAGSAWLLGALPRLAAGDAEPAVRRLYTVMRGVGMILAACGYIRHDYGSAAR
jgi:GT2 family glycosyltransferase